MCMFVLKFMRIYLSISGVLKCKKMLLLFLRLHFSMDGCVLGGKSVCRIVWPFLQGANLET